MIEPTETESKETLDRFAWALRSIAREIKESPNIVKEAPYTKSTGRLDEVIAARKLNLRWHAPYNRMKKETKEDQKKEEEQQPPTE
jgi:glycine dehydrogenase subunit 2